DEVCDLVYRKRAERERVRLVLNRHHDRVVTARLTVAVTCIEVVSDFVGRNSHAEWRYRFQIGESIGVRWIETYNSRPGDAVGSTQIFSGPQVRNVARCAAKRVIACK